MRRYREVFKPTATQPGHPGRIFYTITEEDIGHTVITVSAGSAKISIHVQDVLGRILPQDVGKRLYYVPCHDLSAPWIWQAESDRQRDARINKGKVIHVRNDSADGQAVEKAQTAMKRWHDAGFAVAPVPADGREHPYTGGRFPRVCPACSAQED